MVQGGNGSVITTNMELFNGDIWQKSSILLNTARHGFNSAGIVNDCIAIAGNDTKYKKLNTCEIFNGSTCIVSEYLVSTARYSHMAVGNINSCMIQGGKSNLTGSTTYELLEGSTELFDGSSWKFGKSSIESKCDHSSVGTVINCMIIGGNRSTRESVFTDVIEIYDGSIWSILSSKLNTGRFSHNSAGVVNNCMVQGGYTLNGESIDNRITTEFFNGSIWNIGTNINQARSNHSSTGIATDCMIQGGYGSNTLNITESYLTL